MKKQRIEKLIPIANEILREQMESGGEAILKKNGDINSTYDGKIAALGVSVAMSGLRPTLAMYFNDSGSVKTKPILEVIAKIIRKDGIYVNSNVLDSAPALLSHALDTSSNLDELKKYVLESAVALKQVVRTYNLVKS